MKSLAYCLLKESPPYIFCIVYYWTPPLKVKLSASGSVHFCIKVYTSIPLLNPICSSCMDGYGESEERCLLCFFYPGWYYHHPSS